MFSIELKSHHYLYFFVFLLISSQVNLDSRTRLETADLVEAPDEHAFDGAQKRIEALMEKDSYPRFMRSEMYHKLLKESKKKWELRGTRNNVDV